MPLPVSRGGSFHSVGCKLSFGTSPRVSATHRSFPTCCLRGAEQVPFDCKYKLYGGNRKISTGDIYQTFVYAFALSGQSADGARAGILYPSDSPATAPVLGISQVEGPPAAVLTGIGFDVVNILNAMGNPAEWEQTLESVRGSLGRVLNGEAA